MTASHEHLISAEEVMRRVRVKLGVAYPGAGSASSPLQSDGSHPESESLLGPVVRDFERKAQYVLGDLVRYDDAEFITNAYRAVLRREPDAGASSYLRMLRAGHMSKAEILGRLRWSEEGLSRSVHVDGLLIPYKLQTWRRIRVLGRPLAWMLDILRLPSLLNRLDARVGNVSGDVQAVRDALIRVTSAHASRLGSIESGVEALPSREAIDELRSRMDAHAERVAAEIDKLASSSAASGRGEDATGGRDLDQLYADFEDQFRGSEEQIRQRLEPYLKFVSDVGAGSEMAPVLDLGCGRGEWLEMLQAGGMAASGVDLNRVFVKACQTKGLKVSAEDAIAKLRSLPARSVGLVTSFHLVEHLPFEVMVDLFDEAHRVLVPGGGMIIETPNPENALVAQWAFYMDPTHRNPLPPEMLRWMIASRGFAQADIHRLYTARHSTALEAVPEDVGGAATINALADPYRASLDYAVIARKSVSAL